MERVKDPLALPDVKWQRHDPEYIRLLLERAGLSQRAAARQLGITDRTMRYYVSGEQPIPYSVQYCLEALAARGQPYAFAVNETTAEDFRRAPSHPIRNRTVWYDATERPLTDDDAGMILVGKDRFGGSVVGTVGRDHFGMVIKELHPQPVDSRSVPVAKVTTYTLLDPPPAT